MPLELLLLSPAVYNFPYKDFSEVEIYYPPLANNVMPFARNQNTDYIYNVLTSDKISEMSGGRIPKMTPQQAAGLIGSWIVETGDPTLTDLDVVERGSGAGRGLSQYTGSRRIAYDRARAAALSTGLDPNQSSWQMGYFVDEYLGKHDTDGRSLSGWTRNFEKAPAGQTPAQYADYYTGSEAEQRGYFRPRKPHLVERQKAAQEVFNSYQQKLQPQIQIPPKPKQQQQNKPTPPSKGKNNNNNGSPLSGIINPILNVLGIPTN